jgi:D-methionine transport system ATP-binding protein
MSEIFLNPKTDITKKLIYSSKLTTKLSDNNTLRILFDGNIDEPLIANIIQDCNILVSIVYADSKVIDGKVYGQLVLKLPEKTRDIDKLKKYLDFKNVKYEEVRKDD